MTNDRTMTPSGLKSETAGNAPLTHRISVTDVPESGRQVEIAANEAARAELARSAEVQAVDSMVARFEVARHRGGLRVTGEVEGLVTQECVVTLEPVRNTVRESVDLTFLPPDDIAAVVAQAKVDEDDAPETMIPVVDPPEPLEHGGVDLGAIATEFFILGIDPYPRKPDASFDLAQPAPDPAEHPFAALAALKRGPGSADS